MKRLFGMLACLVLGALAVHARWALDQQAASREMSASATRFLAALEPAQRELAAIAFDGPERTNWHFVPRERKGIALGALSESQRALAQALFASALSAQGLRKLEGILELEQVLRELESRPGSPASHRDPGRYFVTIFGQPGASAPWGWRVEGHHLSLNFLLAPELGIAVTPSFLGAHPARVAKGPRQGLRVLAEEEDLGLRIFRGLNEQQRAACLLPGEVPGDVILGPSREASLLEPRGLAVAEMADAQRQDLLELIRAAVGNLRDDLALAVEQRLLGEGELYFAFGGSGEAGRPHYHRVQNRRFVIEFDHAGGDPDHVHTVWRDLEDDFGADLLRRHHEESHRER